MAPWKCMESTPTCQILTSKKRRTFKTPFLNKLFLPVKVLRKCIMKRDHCKFCTQIYNCFHFLRYFCNNFTVNFRFPNAAVSLTFLSLESTMRSWRNKFQLPISRTFEDFFAKVSDDRWGSVISYSNGRFAIRYRVGEDGSKTIGFADINFIARVTTFASKMMGDATFQITPTLEDAYQVFILMVLAFGHVSKTYLTKFYFSTFCLFFNQSAFDKLMWQWKKVIKIWNGVAIRNLLAQMYSML